MVRFVTRSRHTVTALTLTAAATLVGCSSAPRAEPAAQAVLYRTTPVLLESSETEPVQLTLAAGDNLGLHLRDVFLARAALSPIEPHETFVIAQTEP